MEGRRRQHLREKYRWHFDVSERQKHGSELPLTTVFGLRLHWQDIISRMGGAFYTNAFIQLILVGCQICLSILFFAWETSVN